MPIVCLSQAIYSCKYCLQQLQRLAALIPCSYLAWTGSVKVANPKWQLLTHFPLLPMKQSFSLPLLNYATEHKAFRREQSGKSCMCALEIHLRCTYQGGEKKSSNYFLNTYTILRVLFWCCDNRQLVLSFSSEFSQGLSEKITQRELFFLFSLWHLVW